MSLLSRSRRTLGLLACLLLTPAVALACLWDTDTLKQEESRFPDTLELITGKFLRHSKEFYEWRIQDRLKKLEVQIRDVTYLEDLAVAYEKVGDHAKAIETILKKNQIEPGVYETYSNLGTFHILAGDFEKGLPYIDQALAINPNAHFGRERYQKWLVEYAMERKKDGKLSFPMRNVSEKGEEGPVGFADFVRQRLGKEKLTQEDRQQATKGVLGMMRFADHENPLLLEALGDLLYQKYWQSDAKQLAARAYLKASYGMKDDGPREAYRKLASQALEMQVEPGTYNKISLSELEATFKQELADAQKWYDELHAKELNWIREGKDVEAEFDKLYEADEKTTPTGGALRVTSWSLGFLALLVVAMWWRRGR